MVKSHGSLFRDWLERLRRRRAERFEERDWRRRVILASRKIQHVQMALSADVADVRSLKSNLSGVRPAMERLTQELGTSRETAGTLGEQLVEHLQFLRSHVESLRPAGGHGAGLATGVDQERRSSQADLELVRHAYPTITSEREKNLETQLGDAQRRSAELEVQLRGLEALRIESEEAHALIDRLREDASRRVASLENRLRSAEDDRARLHLVREREVAAIRQVSQSRIRELEQEAAACRTAHERREFELSASLAHAKERVDELESRLAEISVAREEEEARGLEPSEQLEERIESLQALVAELDDSRRGIQRDHGRELAEHTAKILELEAFSQQLDGLRQQLEEERDAAKSELEVLQAKLLAIEVEHAEGIQELGSKHERVVAALQDRLRESEMARVDLETRHQRDMIDFADHSRERVRTMQTILQEKQREMTLLQQRLGDIERKNERLQRAAEELERLRAEMESSGERLGEQTTRLGEQTIRLRDIMRFVENEDAEAKAPETQPI